MEKGNSTDERATFTEALLRSRGDLQTHSPNRWSDAVREGGILARDQSTKSWKR